MDLVKFGMNSAALANKIKELGIDLEPTDDYLQALRKAGAQEPCSARRVLVLFTRDGPRFVTPHGPSGPPEPRRWLPLRGNVVSP